MKRFANALRSSLRKAVKPLLLRLNSLAVRRAEAKIRRLSALRHDLVWREVDERQRQVARVVHRIEIMRW